MTLVIALQGAKSIWLVADRRLTYPNRQRNDACKILTVEGNNGVALLGYAGLGASARNTEPSSWMNDLLVGLPVMPIEGYLNVIAQAMQAELPQHLSKMPTTQAHHLIAPALIDGEPRLYGIFLELGQGGKMPRFVYTRFARTENGGPPPRLALAGSGLNHIPPPKQWYRELFRLVVAFERGRVSPRAVADRLACINEQAAIKDRSVSPECIVTWRLNGGGFQFYSGSKRINADKPIPAVANGMDIQDLVNISMAFALKDFAAMRKGEATQNHGSEIQSELDKLSSKVKRKL